MKFSERVLKVVAQIPKGSVMTYKEVAIAAGSPNAARAVGSILRKNSNLEVPCHRVIKSDGTAGQYNGLRGENKEDILLEEIRDLKELGLPTTKHPYN